MNNYKPAAQARDGVFTFVVVVVIIASAFAVACYYNHIAVLPAAHHLLDQLMNNPNTRSNGQAP